MKGDRIMIYDGCMCKCKEAYKRMKNLTLFTIASIGVGTGIYLACQRSKKISEDKEYYRRYTEYNPDEDYKARMDFYEAEFKRQDEEEEAELKKAVEEFNSKRLKREECPHCGRKPESE